jgi:hypothetical protein
VDCGFAELRPSPWRQAVDLANMLLCLALGRDAPSVYERACRIFSPDDIAESFAATRRVTIPTQLRTLLDADGRDLVERFRELAPRRAPVRIQHWSSRRLAAIAATIGLAGLTLWAALTVFIWHDRSRVDPPRCPNSSEVLLAAQSVPSAPVVPCVAVVPEDWTLDATHVDQSGTDLTFRRGATVVHIVLARCAPTAGAAPTPLQTPGPTAAAGPSGATAVPAFEEAGPTARSWVDRMGDACLTAVVSGPDASRDADAVAEIGPALRWIDRHRLDSTVANLTDGRVDAV